MASVTEDRLSELEAHSLGPYRQELMDSPSADPIRRASRVEGTQRSQALVGVERVIGFFDQALLGGTQ